MLLHGGGANAHWWDHIAPTFADQFHVVALDFRGHGDSERPEELIPGAFNEDPADPDFNPADPRFTTPGIGRADVWVFDALALGDTSWC